MQRSKLRRRCAAATAASFTAASVVPHCRRLPPSDSLSPHTTNSVEIARARSIAMSAAMILHVTLEHYWVVFPYSAAADMRSDQAGKVLRAFGTFAVAVLRQR